MAIFQMLLQCFSYSHFPVMLQCFSCGHFPLFLQCVHIVPFQASAVASKWDIFYIVMLQASAVASTWAIVHSVFFQASAVASTWDIFFNIVMFQASAVASTWDIVHIVIFQASAVASTWARRCNKIIFVTSETVTDEGYTVQYIKVYWKCCNVSYFLQQMRLQLRLGCQRNKLLPFWRNKKFDKIHIQVGLFSFHFQTINSFYS